jgi:outer membrane immunogenic protein
MIRQALVCAVAAISFSCGALAADLPTHKPAPVFAPIAAAPFSWTGFYAGVQGGYAWDGEEIYTSNLSNFSYSLGRTGGFGGALVGYDYQINNFVLGASAEYNFSDINGSAAPLPGIAFTTRVNSFGSADGRLGFAFDRFLVYGTGGLAFGSINHSITLVGIQSDSFSSYPVGYDYGGGVEYAFTNNWAASAEYRHYDFGKVNYGAVGALGPHHTIETLSVVKLALIYKFSGM